MASWRFILTSLAGVEKGEIFLGRSKVVDLPLNGTPTVAMQIDLDNPMADVILASTAMDRINLLLKAYRNGTRMFVGPLVSADESVDGDSASLSLSAASPFWRLMHRLLGKAAGGYGDGTALAPKDLGEIAKNMIDVANAEGDTGIRVGTILPSSNGYVGPYYFKKVAEAIMEIGPGLLGGFDFEVVPFEPITDVGGVKIGEFRAHGSLGQNRPNVIFEMGVGRRNMGSYQRPMTADGIANKVYALPPGHPDSVEEGLSTQESSDAPSIGTRGLFEDVLSDDIQPNSLRLKLAQEHVRIRKVPREQIFFTPIPNAEPDYGEYTVGDTITARAVYRGRVRFDAMFRVYGAKFTIGDDGSETTEIQLANEGS